MILVMRHATTKATTSLSPRSIFLGSLGSRFGGRYGSKPLLRNQSLYHSVYPSSVRLCFRSRRRGSFLAVGAHLDSPVSIALTAATHPSEVSRRL